MAGGLVAGAGGKGDARLSLKIWVSLVGAGCRTGFSCRDVRMLIFDIVVAMQRTSDMHRGVV